MTLDLGQLSALLVHFLSLSFFATGGALALASDMHRYVVDDHHYLTHEQFLASIALAQAAPGPNILFITIMGWQISGFAGAVVTTLGIIAPAMVIPFAVTRLGRSAAFGRLLEAFKRGLAPVAIGLMVSTTWLLGRQVQGPWTGLAMLAAAVPILAFTRVPPVVVILAAGALGAVLPWSA
jgi:chromate transporter